MKYNIKPLFIWAKQRGDANIIDRILVKIIPQLLKDNIKITSNEIENLNEILVSKEIYDLVLSTAQNLVDDTYKEEK